MLDLMRRHAQSWIIKAALGGIIIVFIFWYGWSGPRDKTGDYAAKINDTVITPDSFRSVYDSRMEQIRLRFKGSMPPELLEKMNLKKEIIQEMVNQTLLVQEAERLGFMVTTEDLIQDIRSNPMFQRNGVFDESVYRYALNAIRMTPSMYEQARRQELLSSQVSNLLTEGVKTDSEEIKRFGISKTTSSFFPCSLLNPKNPHRDPRSIPSFWKVFSKRIRTTIQFLHP